MGRGGNGGSGVVVVRYQIGSQQSGTAKATGGSISYYGGKTIHAFTSTGDFNNTTGSNITGCEVIIIGLAVVEVVGKVAVEVLVDFIEMMM